MDCPGRCTGKLDNRGLPARFDPIFIMPRKLPTYNPSKINDQKINNKIFTNKDYNYSTDVFKKYEPKISNLDLEIRPCKMMKDDSLVYIWGKSGVRPQKYHFIPNSKYYNDQLPIFEKN